MNQSELLQSKVIDAHAMLWERVVRIGHNVPHPYNGVLGLFPLLSPVELEVEKRNPERQFSAADEDFRELVDRSQLDLLA